MIEKYNLLPPPKRQIWFWDFRYLYPVAFLITNILSLTLFDHWDNEFLGYYTACSIVFFLALWFGAGLAGKVTCHAAVVPELLRPWRMVSLFIVAQFYYISYIVAFLSMYHGDFEVARFKVESHVNLYFGQFAYVSCILSLAYFLYAALLRSDFHRKGVNFHWGLFIFFLSITVLEFFLMGSRARILTLFLILGLVYCRYRHLSKKSILMIGGLFVIMFGWIQYFRISTNPDSFAWWVRSGIVEQDSSIPYIIYSMVAHTFFGIGERTVVLFRALMNNEIPIQYGYDSFFYFVSALPGKQVNPSVWLNHNLFHGSDSDAGYPPTIIAQLYWDFGALGIPLGGFIIGLLGGWLRIKSQVRSVVWTVAYALFLAQCLLSLYGEFRLGWLLANIIMFVFLDYGMRGRIRLWRSDKTLISEWNLGNRCIE